MVGSKRFLTLGGVVLFWIGTLFSVLYLPYILPFFKIKKDSSITILVWSGVIDTKLFEQFERETGIRVTTCYFEGNEELMVKLLATKGSGYDMIVPSDYAVSFFIKNGLLQKIDKTKLDFWHRINPVFLNHSFDPDNEYSVPAEWYILGLGINKDHFKYSMPEASWKTLFNPESYYKVGLLNDIRELATVALLYQEGNLRQPTAMQMKRVSELLAAQKHHVEAYTDFRGDFLLESGSCSVVVLALQAVWKSVIRNESRIAFLIPQEGTLLGIENYVIPAMSRKQDLVYAFMNFLFRYEVQRHNFEHRAFLSTCKDADFLTAYSLLSESLNAVEKGHAIPFENVFTEEQINEYSLAMKG